MINNIKKNYTNNKNFIFYKKNLFKKKIKKHIISNNFNTLIINNPIVHIKHGIGLYKGLKKLKINETIAEYIVIKYAENTKLYVPITSIHLLNVYINKKNKNFSINKLGNDTWSKIRKKVINKIKDTAAELLKIHAVRSTKKGYSFKYKNEEYKFFCNSFPFNTTSDQEKAIKDVLNDMEKNIPMDRLICGDVGFGKTEIAMRAAFIAVKNKKQVAILVPTTLLAQQHFYTFKNRFFNLPFHIEMISRFRSLKEQKNILKNVISGNIDILIGTHKLLQNNIKWFDLGLLVIDEEHRFGVRHKEKIKKMRNNIDILTLTATPIPRTLNMAINGIRDLSIISTAPKNRLKIKTFISEYNEKIVRKAILQEVLRGGQVYYLYNDIENIEKAAKRIKRLVPEAAVDVGHGKMKEYDLENVMNNFYKKNFNVLVCTTIIETGIDVPMANTIIIERADKFGLAQLYQLRGRVGRSYYQAYAWLLTPHPKMISLNAHKRLEAVANVGDLGSGFNLSIEDLEIRGTGELLGEEQSGQIESIGLSLYTKLLNCAVKSLKDKNNNSLENYIDNKTEIELQIPTLFPESFIPNINTRLYFYEKIAHALNKNELNIIKDEITSKFGNLPEEASNLFNITFFKILAKKIGIKKIKIGRTEGFIEFSSKHIINPIWIKNLLNTKVYYYDKKHINQLKFKNIFNIRDNKKKIIWINNLIKNMLNNTINL